MKRKKHRFIFKKKRIDVLTTESRIHRMFCSLFGPVWAQVACLTGVPNSLSVFHIWPALKWIGVEKNRNGRRKASGGGCEGWCVSACRGGVRACWSAWQTCAVVEGDVWLLLAGGGNANALRFPRSRDDNTDNAQLCRGEGTRGSFQHKRFRFSFKRSRQLQPVNPVRLKESIRLQESLPWGAQTHVAYLLFFFIIYFSLSRLRQVFKSDTQNFSNCSDVSRGHAELCPLLFTWVGGPTGNTAMLVWLTQKVENSSAASRKTDAAPTQEGNKIPGWF